MDGRCGRESGGTAQAVDVFRLEQVCVARSDKHLLGPIDWTVSDGRISTIMGPSGSGKTLLLRLLNRLDDPTSGSVFYMGKRLKAWDVRRVRLEVGMVFQRPELFEGTVETNLRYGPDMHGICIDVNEILELVGLPSSILSQDVRTLSGGQAQRVSIGRSLAVDPSTLLLDEPTLGLDPTATLRIESLVKRLVASLGLTCVFVTHDIEQARRLGDSAILIIDGKKVEEGPMADVLSRPRDPRTMQFIRGELT
jgi:putative ABC transport system ATP-binding protein